MCTKRSYILKESCSSRKNSAEAGFFKHVTVLVKYVWPYGGGQTLKEYARNLKLNVEGHVDQVI